MKSIISASFAISMAIALELGVEQYTFDVIHYEGGTDCDDVSYIQPSLYSYTYNWEACACEFHHVDPVLEATTSVCPPFEVVNPFLGPNCLTPEELAIAYDHTWGPDCIEGSGVELPSGECPVGFSWNQDACACFVDAICTLLVSCETGNPELPYLSPIDLCVCISAYDYLSIWDHGLDENCEAIPDPEPTSDCDCDCHHHDCGCHHDC